MTDYWSKGLPIRIADDRNDVEGSIHTIDLKKVGRFMISSPPRIVLENILETILVDNISGARSLLMSDDPFMSFNHHGSIYEASNSATRTAMMGMLAAMASARISLFRSMRIEGGIAEYRSKSDTPIWDIIGLYTGFDEVLADEDWSGSFMEYAKNLAPNCIDAGIYVIFCSKSHGFAMNDRGKQLIQSMPIVGCSAINNQAISHAMGFYSSVKSPGHLYIRGGKYGDITSINADPDASLEEGYLETVAMMANRTLDEPHIMDAVDKIQAGTFERAHDFAQIDNPLRKNNYREALNIQPNGFDPEALVNRLMMVVGSYGIDKNPNIGMIASHMNLSNDETHAVIEAAERRRKGSTDRVKGVS